MATSHITTSTDEDDRVDTNTNLSAENTEDELHSDTHMWTSADRKKLQHMTKFHKEYRHFFGKGASIRMIMKRRISHMKSPIPTSVCEEEMKSTHLDNNEVIIEYMTDAHGNRIKKLKPMLIKSELDREMSNMCIVMIISLLYLKKILLRKER